MEMLAFINLILLLLILGGKRCYCPCSEEICAKEAAKEAAKSEVTQVSPESGLFWGVLLLVVVWVGCYYMLPNLYNEIKQEYQEKHWLGVIICIFMFLIYSVSGVVGTCWMGALIWQSIKKLGWLP